MQTWGRFNIAGELRVLRTPVYYDFKELRLSPKQTRERLSGLGRRNVVAFQTRNPLHRAHEEMAELAVRSVDGTLLLHPVVGMTRPGDVDHYTRVRTYQAVLALSKMRDRTLLSLLPLAMRMAGPREAVWHCIIRRNYGANHMIVGRDHASPEVPPGARPFYEPFEAQELAQKFSDEVGVRIVPFGEMAYVEDEKRYKEVGKIPPGRKYFSISGKRVRQDFLETGTPIPDWMMRPEVAKILMEAHPPRTQQGVCLWFTGLSGSGKSTTAEILTALLLAEGRRVTVLDGDVVRTNLSKGLGFSRADRDTNLKRIGFVAAEVVRHGGVAVCAAVSPYRQTRNEVRQMFRAGCYVEIFVDTPLEICEQRDPKGMYARARAGEIENFTGISDAYEEPDAAEIALETVGQTAEENARRIIDHLRASGFLPQAAFGASSSI
jgi:sulfate adenylyltransferase